MTVRNLVVSGSLTILVSALAIAACSLPLDAGGGCATGTYKCESPTIGPNNRQGLNCGNNCRCIAPSFDTQFVYVCVKPDGSFAETVTPSLEDLSTVMNRNGITCVSKLRCERQ